MLPWLASCCAASRAQGAGHGHSFIPRKGNRMTDTQEKTTRGKRTEVVNKQTGEVVQTSSRLDDDTLRDIGSFDDALAAMRDTGEDVVLADAELGNGFSIADDRVKDRLIKVPLAVLSWDFNKGEYGNPEDGSDEFVSAMVVTQTGEKFVINDGSTGIRKQLQEYTKRTGRQSNMVVRNGLRKSDYFIDKETGIPVARGYTGPKEPAHTYYLDTSA